MPPEADLDQGVGLVSFVPNPEVTRLTTGIGRHPRPLSYASRWLKVFSYRRQKGPACEKPGPNKKTVPIASAGFVPFNMELKRMR
jgi:hypothetical protein